MEIRNKNTYNYDEKQGNKYEIQDKVFDLTWKIWDGPGKEQRRLERCNTILLLNLGDILIK